MHLSPLSDSFFHDRLRAAARPIEAAPILSGEAHRAGVVRGLVFLIAISIPFALAYASAYRAAALGPAGFASTTSPD